MSLWNVVTSPEGFTLLNGHDTSVVTHSLISQDFVLGVLSSLDELEVPVELTRGLERIHFTYLKRGLQGDYVPGHVRVACNNEFRDHVPRTVVHELAHHYDEEAAVSSDPGLIDEWTAVREGLGDTRGRNDVSEYWAESFELFYFDRERMFYDHPIAYWHSLQAHLSGTLDLFKW